MSQQKQNTEPNLDDLTVADEQQDQIKGGPTPQSKRTVLLITGNATNEDGVLSDLEPTEDVSGGGMLLPAVQKVRDA